MLTGQLGSQFATVFAPACKDSKNIYNASRSCYLVWNCKSPWVSHVYPLRLTLKNSSALWQDLQALPQAWLEGVLWSTHRPPPRACISQVLSTAAQGRICFYWYPTNKTADINTHTQSNNQVVSKKSYLMHEGEENRLLSFFQVLEVRP